MQLSSAYLPYSLRKRNRPKLVRKCLPAVTKRRRGGNFSKGGSVFLVGRTGSGCVRNSVSRCPMAPL